jgi:hypothetical protein
MSEKPLNPVKRAYRRYRIEFCLSMIAYVVVVGVSRNLLEGPLRHADPGLQLVIALLPLIPVLFLFAAIVRVVLHVDELSRQIHVNSLAIAGGATALLAVTYGLIESDRMPHLSAWWTYSVFMITWLIASVFVRRRYR